MVSNPPSISHLGHLEGEQPYLGDLVTMAINHLLTGSNWHDPPRSSKYNPPFFLRNLWVPRNALGPCERVNPSHPYTNKICPLSQAEEKKHIPCDKGCMFYLPIHEWVDLYGNLDQSHGFYALPWVSLPTNLL